MFYTPISVPTNYKTIKRKESSWDSVNDCWIIFSRVATCCSSWQWRFSPVAKLPMHFGSWALMMLYHELSGFFGPPSLLDFRAWLSESTVVERCSYVSKSEFKSLWFVKSNRYHCQPWKIESNSNSRNLNWFLSFNLFVIGRYTYKYVKHQKKLHNMQTIAACCWNEIAWEI